MRRPLTEVPDRSRDIRARVSCRHTEDHPSKQIRICVAHASATYRFGTPVNDVTGRKVTAPGPEYDAFVSAMHEFQERCVLRSNISDLSVSVYLLRKSGGAHRGSRCRACRQIVRTAGRRSRRGRCRRESCSGTTHQTTGCPETGRTFSTTTCFQRLDGPERCC